MKKREQRELRLLAIVVMSIAAGRIVLNVFLGDPRTIIDCIQIFTLALLLLLATRQS